MKTNLLIIAAMAAIAPHAADAKLVVTTGSALGSYCYDDLGGETNYADVRNTRLVKCIGANSGYVDYFNNLWGASLSNPCPNDFNNGSTSHCIIGTSDSTVLHCDSADGEGMVCGYCPNRNVGEMNKGWTKWGDGRLYLTIVEYEYTSPKGSFTCTETIKSTKTIYGCEAGYYTYDDETDYSISCDECPENATCTQEDGHTDLFVCNKGYYENMGLCRPCLSSGGIAGTTAGPGATSIRECYLPSNNTGTDSTGTYTLTDDCYYK